MNISILELEINKHSQSYISFFNLGRFELFYVEWDYEQEIRFLTILGIELIY